MEAETTSIARLRVRGGDADSARAALHAERLLGSVSFRPAGLSPSAVLCVRSVRDPKPGALRLDAAAVRAPADWEEGLREALSTAMRGAARPAREAVPAGAEAVLFADRSELLACLAADWLSPAEPRWWWAALVGALPARAVVARTWAEEPRCAPAALDLLARRGLAARLAGELDVAEAAAIAAAVASAFGLPWLRRAVEGLTERAPRGSPAVSGGVAAPPPPWGAAAPEAVAAHLGPLGELFMGALLAVRRAPLVVREPAFARAVGSWVEARPSDASSPSAVRQRVTRTSPRAGGPGSDAERGSAVHAGAESNAGFPRAAEPPHRAEPRPPPPPRADGLAVEPGPPPLPGADEPAVEPEPPPPPRAGEPAVEPGPAFAGSAPAESDTGVETPDRAAAAEGAESGATVETELGGLFFLVVVALRLGLTAEFATPGRRGLGLDPWQLIAELGRRILDGSDRADPAWGLLDGLAGEHADPDRAEELAPWLYVLARYATARLARSLGLGGSGELAGLLLRRHARVSVAPVHVDVVFALAEHPIEIRLAGLDRDPGWLPAAGRHLRFVFE